MAIHFWPSLQIFAYARTALGILHTFDPEILKYRLVSRNLFQTNYVQQIEEKVFGIVLPCFKATSSRLSASSNISKETKYQVLPNEIRKRLVGVVISLGLELIKWYECHTTILYSEDLDLRNRIAWFSFGIVDRFKTAQIFIQDENLSMIKRFYLACKYYFEEDVQMLWKNMSTKDQTFILRRLPYSRSEEIWLEILIRKASLDWKQISLNEKRYFFSENYLGIRYYFTKLQGLEMRSLCIFNALKSKSVHHFDLYLCVSQINANELNAILACLPTSELFEFFKSFLIWPFPIMFLDITNNFMQHINGDIFCDLITFILVTKLGIEFQGNLHVDVLDHFWNPSYGEYKDCIKQEEFFSLVNYVLEYSYFLDLREYMFLILKLFLH